MSVSAHQHKFKYRPDVDGLRALAVIPVVLFHAGFDVFSGGFIGVDIFFLISGFLITSIMISDFKNSTFSLFDFWERRVRRILPALIVVVAATLVASHFILVYPLAYEDFGQSLFAQSFFLANMYFMIKGGYFDGPAEEKPLLHLWSLGVEMQYYVIFPLLLLPILWRRWNLYYFLTLTIIIGFASFLLNVYLVNIKPGDPFVVKGLPRVFSGATNEIAAFFMLFTRAWEFMIGAFLALTQNGIRHKTMAQIIALFGLVAVLFGVFWITPDMVFPGWIATIPVLGTAAIILANGTHTTYVGNFFSLKPVVWVGLISYSLYLWHWPIFVLAKHLWGHDLGMPIIAALLALSVFLSWLTYLFVETPLRRRQFLSGRIVMFASSIACMIAFAGAGLVIYKKDGFPQRLKEFPRAIYLASLNDAPEFKKCLRMSSANLQQQGPCLFGDVHKSGVPDFVLWGDSHADAAASGFDEVAKELGLKGAFIGESACVPLLNTRIKKENPECSAKNKWALDYIVSNDIQNVFMVSRWSVAVRGDSDGNTQWLIGDEDSPPSDNKEAAALVLKRNLLSTVDALQAENRNIFIMREVPLMYDVLGKTVSFAGLVARYKNDSEFSEIKGVSKSQHDEYLSVVDDIFVSVVESTSAVLIDPSVVLCPNGQCLFMDGKTILYKDDDHLNKNGALYIKELHKEFLSKD